MSRLTNNLPTIPEVAEENSHVVFLHSEFGSEDFYIIDAANALQKFGYKVTVLTSFLHAESIIHDFIRDGLVVKFSGWWLPNSICNLFRGAMFKLKAMWMAWKLIICPPEPKPDLVIIDRDSVALSILFWFSNYKTIYIFDIFEYLCERCNNVDSATARTLEYATKIIVHSKYLRTRFERSFSELDISPFVLYPCVNKRFMVEPVMDIKSLIPSLPSGYILYVVFGDYKESSKFQLVLDAFNQMISCTQSSLRNKFHLVIAGNCNENSIEQALHYRDLVENTNKKSYAQQITFMKRVSVAEKKVLIEKCIAVVHPSGCYEYSEIILAAMSLGRLVIATNIGFATEILHDGYTGMLLDSDYRKFAATMFKIAISPILKTFISGRAKDAFDVYSFEKFSQNLHDIVSKCISKN